MVVYYNTGVKRLIGRLEEYNHAAVSRFLSSLPWCHDVCDAPKVIWGSLPMGESWVKML